jgi:uncharacterized protein (TIGR02996 family)
MTSEDDFQRALDADPDDHHTRLVFADWLQDHDDPRAEGYRALGLRRHRPYHRRDNLDGYQFNFLYGRDDNLSHGNDALHGPSKLPRRWFESAKGAAPSHWEWWAEFVTRREAEDAVALAFAKLPADYRAELLAAPRVGG